MKKIYIPNSQYFSANPIKNNEFMEIFGIVAKEHEIENIKNVRITKANKYLKRMYKRLEYYARKTNARGFTVVATLLLKRSISFRLAAINFKWKGWFRIGTGSSAKRLSNDVKVLANTESTKLESKRVWIPKGSEEFARPLGCPTVPWRIYLWMFYYLIDTWISNNKGRAPWQHGGFSKRGPNTFFDQLIGEGFYRRNYIYEFDLKGYFNNITHKSILNALKATKIPDILKKHCQEILKARPTEYSCKFPKEKYITDRNNFGKAKDQIYARQHRWDLLKDETMSDLELHNAINYPPAPKIKSIEIEIEYSDGTKEIKILTSPEATDELGETHPGQAHDWIHGLRNYEVGTPQGVSWSPLLTSVTSSYYFGNEHNKNLMMYMDDGIIAADTEEELNEAIESFKFGAKFMGVEIAPKKSGMVKYAGTWLKDLKIIGFRIDRFLDWVFSSTRSGTEIPMPLPNYEQLREYHTRPERPTFTEDDRSELIQAMNRLDLLPEGSRARFIEWIERSFGRNIEELKEYIENESYNLNDPTHVIMSKTGNTGKVLAKIWNPSEEDIRSKISEGVKLTLESIRKNPKSFIMDKMGPYKIEQIIEIGPKGLQTLSTDMSEEFLKWEQRKKEKLLPKLSKVTKGTLYTQAGVRWNGSKKGW